MHMQREVEKRSSEMASGEPATLHLYALFINEPPFTVELSNVNSTGSTQHHICSQ